MSKVQNAVLEDPLKFAIAAGLVLGVVYFVGKAVLERAAAAAGGIVSGNNALTEGTAYQNRGVLGTAGAAADRASGGALSSIGEAIGSWIFDATHTEYDSNTGLQTGAKTVMDGAKATDGLWGRIGSISLRAQ